mmetsp:Transcript_3884/g.6410  ORF Transcript_3884/g.6410 Transcript_3884/m.6410 type:complete len:230 (+) Transcript_3884:353-1042(+)
MSKSHPTRLLSRSDSRRLPTRLLSRSDSRRLRDREGGGRGRLDRGRRLHDGDGLGSDLAELCNNVGLDVGRAGRGWVAASNLAVATDEEFGEVPLDVGAERLALLRLEPPEERVLVEAVHVHLAEDGEAGIVAVGKGTNLLGRAGLLTAKLVARESKDHKPSVAESLVESLQLAVVCVRQASLAGHVHHQRHLAIVIVERGHATVQALDRKVSERAASRRHARRCVPTR